MITKPVLFENALECQDLAANCIILCIMALIAAYYLVSTFLLNLAFIIARITHESLDRKALPRDLN